MKLKKYGIVLTSIVVTSIISILQITVGGWSNGHSDDPSNQDYGTHDWIAQHPLDWPPENENTIFSRLK